MKLQLKTFVVFFLVAAIVPSFRAIRTDQELQMDQENALNLTVGQKTQEDFMEHILEDLLNEKTRRIAVYFIYLKPMSHQEREKKYLRYQLIVAELILQIQREIEKVMKSRLTETAKQRVIRLLKLVIQRCKQLNKEIISFMNNQHRDHKIKSSQTQLENAGQYYFPIYLGEYKAQKRSIMSIELAVLNLVLDFLQTAVFIAIEVDLAHKSIVGIHKQIKALNVIKKNISKLHLSQLQKKRLLCLIFLVKSKAQSLIVKIKKLVGEPEQAKEPKKIHNSTNLHPILWI